jgi:peptide/nickel transport system ATP-binding protein
VFNPRCAYQDRVAGNLCTTVHPDLTGPSAGRKVRCHIEPSQRQLIWTNEIAPKL